MLEQRDTRSSVPLYSTTRTRTAAADDRRRFHVRLLDGDPHLLAQSYQLRYYVYCRERRFLPAEAYPDRLEVDEFDSHSSHIGIMDAHGELAGTVRLVRSSAAGFPLLQHCRLFPGQTELECAWKGVAEVSRLAVSRRYRRPRDGGNALVNTLYKALYQVSKRCGFTHWLVATEPSFQRLVAEYGCPFTAIGPETDYFGPVTPYFMDLSAWDKVIVSGTFPALSSFLDGLEPELNPRRRFAVA